MSPIRTEKKLGKYCQNHPESANGQWTSIIYVGIHLRRRYDTAVIRDITSHPAYFYMTGVIRCIRKNSSESLTRA
jgi:hypothetical protein